MVKTIKQNINIHLAKFIDKARRDYKLDEINPYLYACIKDFCLRDGKRIRPLLLILSYKGYNAKTKKISSSLYHASSSIEMMHAFMLIHDDIIDKSDLRRGKPTMHKMLEKTVNTDSSNNTLGLDLAIVAGDLIHALAIDSFLSIDEEPVRKQKALKYFIQTVTFTAMGEFIDTLDGLRLVKNVKEKDVLLNYSLKTARYTFENPLVIGAILAGADDKEIKKLEKIGLLIGQAFQIQDDIIGMFDTEKNVGKSLLSDLAESKKTMLVCHAYENLSSRPKKEFLNIFNKEKKSLKDLETVKEIFLNAGSLEYCLRQVQQRVEKSTKLLDNLKMQPEILECIKSTFLDIFKTSKRIADENNISH